MNRLALSRPRDRSALVDLLARAAAGLDSVIRATSTATAVARDVVDLGQSGDTTTVRQSITVGQDDETMSPFFPQLPRGGFDLIMADPPWSFRTWSTKGQEKSPSQHYSTMSLEDIIALPVAELAAPDCLLWLWATNPMLPQAMAVLEGWGFRFKTAGTWVKKTKNGLLGFGTGYLLRSANEPFLIGTRGKPKVTRATRSVIEGPLREHSRKPDEAYRAAESLMPAARRADLFARETRPGWTGWGNESQRFDTDEFGGAEMPSKTHPAAAEIATRGRENG